MNYQEMLEEQLRAARDELAMGANILERYLEEYSPETYVGTIIRKLLSWNNCNVNPEQRFVFRSVLQFNTPSFFSDLSSMISHELLDDGALLLVNHQDGRREFITDSINGTQNPELVLAEINRAEQSIERAKRAKEAAIMRRLIEFCEENGHRVDPAMRKQLAALEAP